MTGRLSLNRRMTKFASVFSVVVRPISPILVLADRKLEGRVSPTRLARPEDTFEVYLGGVEHPLDRSPIWRYMAKDALNGPQVDAVEQFRKAIAESEEARQQKN